MQQNIAVNIRAGFDKCVTDPGESGLVAVEHGNTHAVRREIKGDRGAEPAGAVCQPGHRSRKSRTFLPPTHELTLLSSLVERKVQMPAAACASVVCSMIDMTSAEICRWLRIPISSHARTSSDFVPIRVDSGALAIVAAISSTVLRS